MTNATLGFPCHGTNDSVTTKGQRGPRRKLIVHRQLNGQRQDVTTSFGCSLALKSKAADMDDRRTQRCRNLSREALIQQYWYGQKPSPPPLKNRNAGMPGRRQRSGRTSNASNRRNRSERGGSKSKRVPEQHFKCTESKWRQCASPLRKEAHRRDEEPKYKLQQRTVTGNSQASCGANAAHGGSMLLRRN
jgi:hypothetical protein